MQHSEIIIKFLFPFVVTVFRINNFLTIMYQNKTDEVPENFPFFFQTVYKMTEV